MGPDEMMYDQQEREITEAYDEECRQNDEAHDE